MARLSRTIWPIFSSFLIFCCYFTRLKAREVTQQNIRKWKNIGHIEPYDKIRIQLSYHNYITVYISLFLYISFIQLTD